MRCCNALRSLKCKVSEQFICLEHGEPPMDPHITSGAPREPACRRVAPSELGGQHCTAASWGLVLEIWVSSSPFLATEPCARRMERVVRPQGKQT